MHTQSSVAIVIVTYNRLDLLKEGIERINKYASSAKNVIIVDNASTDGTREYLETIQDDKYFILTQSENLGGTFGFYAGIKHAVENLNVEYIWIMDDDTFVQDNSMQKLVEKFKLHPKIGFVNSHVVFKDGKAHIMNIPRFSKKYQVEEETFYMTDFLGDNSLLLQTSSFVSLMIRTDVIKEIGYPIREYFIWVDDSEYTGRITSKGYLGLLATDSVVTHFTKINNGTNISHDLNENAWRYYYLLRNKFHYYRTVQRNKLPYFLFIEIPGYLAFILRRKEAKAKYIRSWLKGVVHGLFFNPSVEKYTKGM